MENIQILYEDTVSTLSADIESKLLKGLKMVMSDQQFPKGFVLIYFCSKETSRGLNSQYRNINRPTDVLSWSYIEQDSSEIQEDTPWGELAICLDIVNDQASNTGWELSTELLRLTVHGLVHLLGFDHETEADETEMLGREVKLLTLIGLGDLYEL